MPLLQLMKNTLAREEIPVNLNGRYRVRIIGWYILDNRTSNPQYTFIDSDVLGIHDKCVGTSDVPGIGIHNMNFMASLKEPIELGERQINYYIDLTLTAQGGNTVSYVILNLDVVAVS
jgi:hypothetical protein